MKKICIYVLCGLLSFSVISSSYYKTAHAMEWVGGALAFEEALKWLLAAVGITATAGMTDAYWDAYGDEFVDYAVENGATQTEVAEWQLKACQGIIDKGSQVWTKFKAWASSLVSGGSSGGSSSNFGFYYGINSTDLVNNIANEFNFSFSSNLASFPCYGYFIRYTNDYIEGYGLYLFSDNVNYNIVLGNNNNFSIKEVNNNTMHYSYIRDNINSSTRQVTFYNNTASQSFSNAYIKANETVYFSDNFDISELVEAGFSSNIVTDNNISDTNFDSVTSNVNDLDVISSDGVDEDNPEVTFPMPGVSDSDNEVSKDAYQDIIDAINDGTITQEQGLEQIQEILKIITYDTVTDEVVPPQQNDDGTDKTKDDALKENKDNMGFSLAGLENVFPFCIPFDIYAFMTLLVAEPEAPEVDFPIQSINGEVEEVHIDLSPFDSVAVVVRYIFDFLFIIGLGILTRSLIGGGGSD